MSGYPIPRIIENTLYKVYQLYFTYILPAGDNIEHTIARVNDAMRSFSVNFELNDNSLNLCAASINL